MADGRMLKKVVSESQKLPQLKTDSARLLWTWILPYLDIEGRYFADPDLVKGKVVPRIKTFNPENINDYLLDMADVGLIRLYEINGERYLQFRNFKEFQNLRDNREAKSKIPAPLDENIPTTPGALLENSRITPIESNLIKVKYNHLLSDDNISIIYKEFGEDVDISFYEKNFLKPNINNPLAYLQKIMRNQNGEIKRIKKPPVKSYPIPENYQVMESPSLKICIKCHNEMIRLKNKTNGENILYCEYCGEYEAENPDYDAIAKSIQTAREQLAA